MTAIEAMACGTPVVGARVGGIKYSVLDGRTGFLVPPNDPGALAERVKDVCCSPRLAERFSRLAVRRAYALFPWERWLLARSRSYTPTCSARQRLRKRRRPRGVVAAA